MDLQREHRFGLPDDSSLTLPQIRQGYWCQNVDDDADCVEEEGTTSFLRRGRCHWGVKYSIGILCCVYCQRWRAIGLGPGTRWGRDGGLGQSLEGWMAIKSIKSNNVGIVACCLLSVERLRCCVEIVEDCRYPILSDLPQCQR